MDISPYQPRRFEFVDIWDIHALRIKFYVIDSAPHVRDLSIAISASKQYVVDNVASIREDEGPDHGLGYAMLHAGKISNWLLVHWWAHEDIVLRMLASSEDISAPVFISQDDRRFHACVWEHIIIDFERNSWVKNMMCKHSSARAYLADTLPIGHY